MLILNSQHNLANKPLSFDYRSPNHRGNIVYGTHKEIYENITMVKTLAKANFSVYLVNSDVTNLNYAMKVFPYRNGEPTINFRNESRYTSLRHPNIIKYLYSNIQKEALIHNKITKVSYIIMENAVNGSFWSFFKDFSSFFDDKLIRTYFRQLINGLEYLHSNDIAHMDLKLDNFLLDQDYILKMADFDLSHYKEDAIIISSGTKYFRAPELITDKCNKPKLADIYSAGIILFILKAKGVLPQYEDDPIDFVDFAEMLHYNPDAFWRFHSKTEKQSKITFEQDFKDLFIAMTKLNPLERASFEEIKASKWYNGPCYSDTELKDKIKGFFYLKLEKDLCV